jgi:hypothetical protein
MPDAGDVAGFAADVVTDPLTWAGSALGSLAAKGAYKALGPMHRGGASKLAEALAGDKTHAFMARELLDSPHASRILREIPPGSNLLPGGVEALPFKTPAGDVVRLATEGEAAPLSRAAIPEMLQPTRNVTIGNYRVERVPWAEGVGDDLLMNDLETLERSFWKAGFEPVDFHSGNIGRHGGRRVVIDPGAVTPRSDFRGVLPLAQDMVGPTPKHFRGPGMAGGAAVSPLLQRLLAMSQPGYEELDRRQ